MGFVLNSRMFQITISDRFMSVITPDPIAALRIQMWAEDHLAGQGMTLSIFVREPGYPLEFWNRIFL